MSTQPRKVSLEMNSAIGRHNKMVANTRDLPPLTVGGMQPMVAPQMMNDFMTAGPPHEFMMGGAVAPHHDAYGMPLHPAAHHPHPVMNSLHTPMHPVEAASIGMMDHDFMNFPPNRGVPSHQQLHQQRQRGVRGNMSMGVVPGGPMQTSTVRPGMIPSQAGSMAPARPERKVRAPSSTSFPTKLYKILMDPQYAEFITWLQHGRAWRVLKPKAFEETVLPKFFRSDRYASFMRQVNGWGFRRIQNGIDANSYYHEMFLRGLPHVAAKMRRPPSGKAAQAANNARDLGQAPDFYKISMLAPLPPLESSEVSPKGTIKQTIGAKEEKHSPGVVSNDEESKHDGTVSTDPSTPVSDRKSLTCGSSVASMASAKSDVSALLTMGTPLLNSPEQPTPTQDFASRAHSFSSPGSLEFNHEHASSAASISSWTDPQEGDPLWGNMYGSASLVGSPATGIYNRFGQVTPPGGRTRRRPPATHSFNMSPLEADDDSSGLSAADLCYLTQQNRILLSQAHKQRDSSVSNPPRYPSTINTGM